MQSWQGGESNTKPETNAYPQAYWSQQGPQGYGDYYSYGLQQPPIQENQLQVTEDKQEQAQRPAGASHNQYGQYYSYQYQQSQFDYQNAYYAQYQQTYPQTQQIPVIHPTAQQTQPDPYTQNTNVLGEPPDTFGARDMYPGKASQSIPEQPLPTPHLHQPLPVPLHFQLPAHQPLPPPIPQSALDARIQAFMSSTDPKHGPVVAKLRKLGEGKEGKAPALRRSLSSSSDATTESGFSKVPPFQEFAGPPVVNAGDPMAKRKRIFEELETRVSTALILGVVEAKRPFGLLIQIRKVTDLDGVAERGLLSASSLEPFRIKCLCHLSELSNEFTSDVDQLDEEYSVGKLVRGTLLAVDVQNERINLSFKSSRLPSTCDFVLGPLRGSEAKSGDQSPMTGTGTPYNAFLHEDPSFANPGALETMTRHFKIDECALTFLGVNFSLEELLAANSYERLRDTQNEQWAQETVSKGIGYAKHGDYKKAMQCYQQALEVDPRHRDAFVARGAAYANMSMLDAAVEEFETALKIDPEDRNAKKYLQVTKEKVHAREKEREKEKEKEREKNKEKEQTPTKGGAVAGGSRVDKEEKEEKKEDKQLTDKIKNLLEAEERERKRKKKKKKDKGKDKDKREREKEKEKGKKHKKEHKHKHKHRKRKHGGVSDSDSDSDSVEELDGHGKPKKRRVISVSP